MRHTPGRIASFEIQILMDTTARAFGVKGKRVWNDPPQKALHEYMKFTIFCMQLAETDPDRLYAESFRTGSLIRRITGFKALRDVEELVFYLYGNIGIAMDGRLPGEIQVYRCFFSRYYSPDQCALMSAVDDGMTAGIAGGGRLHFSERLTEGGRTCRAVFTGSLQELRRTGNGRRKAEFENRNRRRHRRRGRNDRK